jgi:hypothetical protein
MFGANAAFKTFASEHGICMQQNEIKAKSEGLIHPMIRSHRMNRLKPVSMKKKRTVAFVTGRL